MSGEELPGFGKKRVINLGGDEVILDPQALKFSDPTLNQFFEVVSGYCDYYGQKLADANLSVARAEQLFERLYIEKFKEFREGSNGDSGKSEKTSELYAKAESEVVKAKTAVHETAHKRDSILNFLKALNAARDDAHNRGHFLRKEMDKLNMDVRGVTYEMSRTEDPPALTQDDKEDNSSKPSRQPFRRKWTPPEDPDMEALFQETQKREGK